MGWLVKLRPALGFRCRHGVCMCVHVCVCACVGIPESVIVSQIGRCTREPRQFTTDAAPRIQNKRRESLLVVVIDDTTNDRWSIKSTGGRRAQGVHRPADMRTSEPLGLIWFVL